VADFVIVFTSGDTAMRDWPRQALAVHEAVKAATGITPTPLMKTGAGNALVLSVAGDSSAQQLLSAIVSRLRAPLFQLHSTRGTPDCLLAFEVGDIAATEDVARAAFGLSKR
jgi:hypothetical protein